MLHNEREAREAKRLGQEFLQFIERNDGGIGQRVMRIMQDRKDQEGFLRPKQRTKLRKAGFEVWTPRKVIRRILALAGFRRRWIRVEIDSRRWYVLDKQRKVTDEGTWEEVLGGEKFREARILYRKERRGESEESSS